VRRLLSFGSASTEDAALELDQIIVSQRADHPRPSYFLAVERIATKKSIGNVGFEDHAGAAHGNSDIAGIGYASEASMLIINYAFELGASKVIAECDEKNSVGERVMKRCGMVPLDSEKTYQLGRRDEELSHGAKIRYDNHKQHKKRIKEKYSDEAPLIATEEP